MSNNACVCDDGGEIGVAQYTQAVMLGLPTSYHFNSVLLKPQKDNESQVVINGKAAVTQDARAYFKNIDTLKPVVNEASRQYGFWRPYVEQVIYRYLDCGNLPEWVCPCEMQRLRPRIRRISGANICWHSPASAVIFAHHAIRSAWLSLGNGCAWMSSRRSPTGILYSASQKSSAVTSSTIGHFLPISVAVPGNP